MAAPHIKNKEKNTHSSFSTWTFKTTFRCTNEIKKVHILGLATQKHMLLKFELLLKQFYIIYTLFWQLRKIRYLKLLTVFCFNLNLECFRFRLSSFCLAWRPRDRRSVVHWPASCVYAVSVAILELDVLTKMKC